MDCWQSTPSSQATTRRGCVGGRGTLPGCDRTSNPTVISTNVVASSQGREKVNRAYKISIGQESLDLGNNARNIAPLLNKTVSRTIRQIADDIECKVE